MNEDNALVLSSSMTASLTAHQIHAQTNLIQQVMQAVMKPEVHYGIIPGTDKKTLLKPGAEKLCVVFRIAPVFLVEDLSSADEVRYRVRCRGEHQGTGTFLGEGIGECSSMETKYKWRKAYRREYDATPVDRRRMKYGYNKQKREEFEDPQVRTEKEDVANTILKMAAKRAHVHMTLNVTGASDIFHQDLEDLPEELRDSHLDTGNGEGAQQKPEVRQPKAKSEARTAAEARPSSPPPAEGAGEALPADAPATEGMRKIVAAKMEFAALSDLDMKTKFGFDLASMPAARVNDVIAWTKDPVGAEA